MNKKKSLILIYTLVLLTLVSLGSVAGMWIRIARVAGGSQTIIIDVGDIDNFNTTFNVAIDETGLETLVPINVINFDEGIYKNFVIVPMEFTWKSSTVISQTNGTKIESASANFIITAKPTFNCIETDNILVNANEGRIHVMAIANDILDEDFLTTLSNAFAKVTCTEDAIPEMAKQFNILLEEPVQNDMYDFTLDMSYGDSVFVYFIVFICSNIIPAELVYINSDAVISLSLSMTMENLDYKLT